MSVLPSYAGSVAVNAYDPSRNVYNWKASNTRRHRAGLARAASGGLAAQVFFGDSLTTGCVGGSTMDRLHAWPRIYANTLAEIGFPSASSGFVRIMDGTVRDDRWTVSGSWYAGYCSAMTTVAGSSATLTVPNAGTSVAVVFTGGSSTTLAISVDGATSGVGYLVVPTGGPSGVLRRVVVSGLADRAHTVKVTSLSSSALTLIGAEILRSSGLICHNVAQGGSTAASTGQASWSDSNGTLGTRLLPMFRPSSAVYGQVPTTVHCSLGGNDINKGLTVDQIAAAITTIRAACPESDFFLYLEPQPARTPLSAWGPLGTRLYALADQLDVPLFDIHDRLGGYDSEAANGLTCDTVAHLNAAGYADWGRSTALTAAG
jgi:lysophospholipase L1-like esterase